MLHGLMFVCAIMFVLVHVYLGTIGNPGTLESMLWGNVRKNWARHHHPRWYREKMKSEG
jgi:formate dehydrogenase subunit gamma